MTKKTSTLNRPSIGQISGDLLNQEADPVSIIEQQRAMQEDYVKNLEECIQTHKKLWTNQDFFVVIITKQEAVMKNVFRNYFLARQSCPTPDYDQVVWHYHASKDDYEFLWAIPDKITCLTFLENQAIIDPENWELLSCILKFNDGTYFQQAKKLNGETVNPGVVLIDA